MKQTSLDYKVRSSITNTKFDRSLFFKCVNSSLFDFKIRESEIDKDQLAFWKEVEKNQTPIMFYGEANRFYDLGFGTLEGYLTTAAAPNRTEVVIKSGELKKPSLMQRYYEWKLDKVSERVRELDKQWNDLSNELAISTNPLLTPNRDGAYNFLMTILLSKVDERLEKAERKQKRLKDKLHLKG